MTRISKKRNLEKKGNFEIDYGAKFTIKKDCSPLHFCKGGFLNYSLTEKARVSFPFKRIIACPSFDYKNQVV